MTQLADFNGLKSSPEPIPHRSQSRDKGKGKAGLASAVTESESESDDNLGPSTQKRKHDTSYTRRPTGSLNTSGAGPSKQKSTPYIDGHLLFPTSDEEDEPPVPIAVGREPIPFSDPDPDPNTQPPIPTKTDPQPFTPPDSAPTPDLDSLVLEDVDPTSRVLVHRILEIMPDVNPIRVLGLIQTHPPTFSVSYDHGYGGGEDAAVERGGGEWEVTIKEQVARYVLLLCEDPKVDPQYEKEEDKRVEEDEEDSREDDGTTIECQYCFAEYPLSKIVQCPEAHLFCSTCVSTYVATQLGNSNSSLTCIHYSSCSLPFPPSELKRILPVKSYKLYEQLEQQKQIMQAGLMGFEMCPFCEWTCLLVSGEEDKPFICRIEAGGCGVVSCRECQKLVCVPSLSSWFVLNGFVEPIGSSPEKLPRSGRRE
ncbi:hypothetical protein BYT27DRAFT_6378451 [Phlegmacium glaucopus]|nr:hypothetical protein BYT27DRAFT_6378451 [Phlegmacium glaucopus]